MTRDAQGSHIFRNLLEASVHEYEARQRENAAHGARLAKTREQSVLNTAAVFPDLRVDRSALSAASARDKTVLDGRLATVHSTFAGRERGPQHTSRGPSLFSATNRMSIPLFAAALMADDHAQFDGIEGERGNPWILPSNPAELNVKVASQGFGDALFLWGGPTYHTLQTARIDLWFQFWPDKSALWSLTAVVDLFGYYYLRSNDEWYNSKWAKARISARVGVYQYFWTGVKAFALLDANEDNVDEGRTFDDVGWFDTQGFLRAGDPAWFVVHLDLSVEAHGDGSYAEINFSDGVANFIRPLVLLAGA